MVSEIAKPGKRSAAFLISLLTGAAVSPICSHAQTARATGQIAASIEPASATVGEVVVTAQKRSERLVDVPITVSVVSEAKMAAAGVTGITGLTQVVPGLRFDLSGNFVEPTIRGVTSSVTGPGVSNAVAIYVDGFYFPDQVGLDFDLPDTASVQVSKGPQGTLFGRNTTGGAIIVTTKTPGFTPEGLVSLSYGNYNEVRANAYLTGPLTNDLAGSLTFSDHRSDGFDHNIVTGQREGDFDTLGVRGKLLYRPTDSTEVTLSASYSRVNNPNATLFALYQGQGDGALFPGVAVPISRGQVANDTPNENLINLYGVFLKATHRFNWGSLTSYTSYQQLTQPKSEFDIDAVFLPLEYASAYPESDKTFTQEFDLSGKSGPLNWVTGVFYMNQAASQPPLSVSVGTVDGGEVLPNPPAPILISEQTINSFAAFADTTYSLRDNLFLTLGGRVSLDDLGESFGLAYNNYLPPNPLPHKDYVDFTPRAVIRYEFTHDSNVYASVSRGSKSGTFNAAGLQIAPIKPERITAYEVGFKTAQPHYQIEASAFYYNYADLQETSVEGAVSITQNAGRARIYGVDGHFAADLTDAFRLDVGGEYLNAKYVSFENASKVVWCAPGGTVTLACPAPGLQDSGADASGLQMPRAPSFSGNAGLTYHQPLMSGNLEVSGNYSYQTSVIFDQFGLNRQGAYGVLNLRVSWTGPDSKWAFAVYGKNVTDEAYLTQVVQEKPLSNLAQYGWPATYGVELTRRF